MFTLTFGIGGSAQEGAIWLAQQALAAERTALLVCRTQAELATLLQPETVSLYASAGVTYNASKDLWQFPAGKRIYLTALPAPDDYLHWGSFVLDYLGLLGGENFTLPEWQFLASRVRPIGEQTGRIAVWPTDATLLFSRQPLRQEV
jgi:hypothetical protein